MTEDPIHDRRELLSELGRLSRETRSATLHDSTYEWLIIWGVAWLLGYGGLAIVRSPIGVIWCLVVVAVASVVSWNPRRARVRTGWQGRLRAGWLVLLLTSPFLMSIVAPLPFDRGMLFLGALWGLGMTLYAVATADIATAAVAGVVIVVAAGAAYQSWMDPLLLFGLGGGLPLVLLGLWRCLATRVGVMR